MNEYEIEESNYGDECWYGGEGHGMITVGEWTNGGCKTRPAEWEKLQKEAQIIAKALNEAKERGEL